MLIQDVVPRESRRATGEIEMGAARPERSELHTFTGKLINQNESRQYISNFSAMPERFKEARCKSSPLVPD
jgi:hypothetical protein